VSLEQQTATSEVLGVISRDSPGELEPVFHAMLENATRICKAQFGTLYECEGDAFRPVALHNASAGYERRQSNVLLRPPPDVPLGLAVATQEGGTDRRRQDDRSLT
jgi:hypothetical protein